MKTTPQKFDVAIVGGGIVGLANAWMASRQGNSVVLFERNRIACGASVRNFGMVWPVGQPESLFDMAMRSREFWLELKRDASIWANECGSLHLARQGDELDVLTEFLDQDHRKSELKMLSPDQVVKKSPGANPVGLLAALWSPFELCVNAPQAIRQITRWLCQQPNVCHQPGSTIIRIEDGILTSSSGARFCAERIAVCSGSDFETLFPNHFENAGLRKCKLQMLATPSQPNNWKLGPHLAGGLTLRHYRSFDKCPSLAKLKARIANEKPLLDKFGIHVMASQNDQGQVILGDSHVYDEEITPFDSQQIDQLILDELKDLIQVPNVEIERRWHGVYAKHPTEHVHISEPQPNCKIVTATGGAGMTLSFGLSEQIWKEW